MLCVFVFRISNYQWHPGLAQVLRDFYFHGFPLKVLQQQQEHKLTTASRLCKIFFHAQ